MKHVAIIGKSRSGKDTVGQLLVCHASYTRLAFADRLKDAALRVDPLLDSGDDLQECGCCYTEPLRLAEAVRMYGWEDVKDMYPEARRFLQEYGQTVREMDPEFWIRPVAEQVWNGTRLNMPCVITDVRYLNEVDALRELGALVVRVERPGAGLEGDAAWHSSETELDDVKPDVVLPNGGSLDDLKRNVRALYTERLTGR